MFPGSAVGKASRSKRLRRESGWKRDRTPKAPPAPDPNPPAARLGVCRACGATGLVTTDKGTCTGTTALDNRGVTKVKSRAAACRARQRRRRGS